MREVAVTEGDKVSAQAKFGYSVNAYGIGDLIVYVDGASDDAVSKLCAEYEERYTVAKELGRMGHVTIRFAMVRELSLGCAIFSRLATSRGLRLTFKFCTGSSNCLGMLCSV